MGIVLSVRIILSGGGYVHFLFVRFEDDGKILILTANGVVVGGKRRVVVGLIVFCVIYIGPPLLMTECDC